MAGHDDGVVVVERVQEQVDSLMRRMQYSWRAYAGEAIRDLQATDERQMTGAELATLELVEEGLPVFRRPLPAAEDWKKDPGEYRYTSFSREG